MLVVCLQDEAFYSSFDKVIKHIEANRKDKPNKWTDGEEAIRYLELNLRRP